MALARLEEVDRPERMTTLRLVRTGRATLAAALAVLALWAAPAAARELHWRALDVEARLDARGHLHVRERHGMVFSGDYNGGERSFNVRDGQDLVFGSIARIGADGREQALVEGRLRDVDEYAWFEPYILRWRSRLPTSPGFDDTELDYRIDYELIDVLLLEGGRDFVLAHDFAFSERPGPIERFRLHLELDPAWQIDAPQPIELEREGLPPGETVVLTLSLHHGGAELPRRSTWLERRLRHLPSHMPLRLGLVVALLAAAVALWTRLGARARASGHLDPLTPDEDIDAAWVERHVLACKPEVVGAIFDGEVGAPEVSALLARLEMEGKLKTVVRPTGEGRPYAELELELLVPRGAFVGHERDLIAKLFFSGAQTSTERIREQYRDVGFNPAAVLQMPLLAEARRVLALGGAPRDHRSCLGALLLAPAVLGLNALVMQMLLARSLWPVAPVHIASAGCITIFSLVGAGWSARFRNDVSDPFRAARLLRGWLVVACVAFVPMLLFVPKLGPLGLVLFCALGIAVVASVLWLAVPQDYPQAIAMRKHLVAARRYFERQLGEPAPQLADEWYPYLIAFGLAPDLDMWLGVHGPRVQREPEPESERSPSSTASTASASSAPSDGAAPRWTGGGGRFGGAGASASWASAVSGLASGVAAPQAASGSGDSSASSGTSSVSSSSDSDSASSGGGGGGGW